MSALADAVERVRALAEKTEASAAETRQQAATQNKSLTKWLIIHAEGEERIAADLRLILDALDSTGTCANCGGLTLPAMRANCDADDVMKCMHTGCTTMIGPEDPHYSADEGERLCPEHAPTWQQLVNLQIDCGLEEAEEDAREILDQIQSGELDGNAKAIYPPIPAAPPQPREVG
jgi:hypothetical protein